MADYFTIAAAIREVARQHKLYNKTAFEGWLDKAKKSDKAYELIPEDLRVPMAPHVIELALDEFFCKAIKLQHCTPIPKLHLCQCNKVMMLHQDMNTITCDRVTIGMIKTSDKGWDCNTALENNLCSFKQEVSCDSWPGVDNVILRPAQEARHDPLNREAAGGFEQPPRFANTRDDAASSGDKSSNGDSLSFSQPPPVQPSGQAADWNDEDL